MLDGTKEESDEETTEGNMGHSEQQQQKQCETFNIVGGVKDGLKWNEWRSNWFFFQIDAILES